MFHNNMSAVVLLCVRLTLERITAALHHALQHTPQDWTQGILLPYFYLARSLAPPRPDWLLKPEQRLDTWLRRNRRS